EQHLRLLVAVCDDDIDRAVTVDVPKGGASAVLRQRKRVRLSRQVGFEQPVAVPKELIRSIGWDLGLVAVCLKHVEIAVAVEVDEPDSPTRVETALDRHRSASAGRTGLAREERPRFG